MGINIVLAYKALPHLLYGAWVSLQITILSYSIGLVGGIVLGYLHTLRTAWVRVPISLYVTVIQGTPILIQIIFFYYVLPLVGINLPPFLAAVCAIGINSSAYISQIIKSGITGVGQEQIEAAQVLGFSTFQIGSYIVIPQAVRIAFPALVGEYITLLKDSSLASIIGVTELYKEARFIMNQTYDVITVFVLVAFFYLIMTLVSRFLLSSLERKINWHAENK
jgi:His/Glu/Gln/Arg/opine family amino acid ABC transporter permease subunit